MLSGALIFLVNTVFGLFVVALLLRFYLQWARAPYRNPLSEFLQALTDFMVRPARRLVPGLWGLDLATLALAWLAQGAELAILLQIRGYAFGPEAGVAFAALVLLALVTLFKIGLYIVIAAVIVQVVLSWMGPYNPLMPLANSMTRPFLRVFQRRIPPIGNVDLSPLFLLVAIQLLLMLPVAWAESALARLL
ncbi:MAG: osmotic-shock protein [Betaproteobacteria bacterium RIFCSPLOWO2_02_FULL_67_26]|nr:MAG: osmotic-shock protein [Betaproteobacteria bacterium RIFCSPLOWO2_02_FULL_67_26]